MQETKGSRNPLIKLAFWIGNRTRTMRFHQGTPKIIAASSISPDSCIIAPVAVLDANGMNLIDPTRSSNSIEPSNQVKPFVYDSAK